VGIKVGFTAYLGLHLRVSPTPVVTDYNSSFTDETS
jgi:hypothetical protein